MKRIALLIIGCISLLSGGVLYGTLRPDTLVHTYIAPVIPLPDYIECECPFLKYYFPDALWALSMGCFLSLVMKRRLAVALTVIGYGAAWELAQSIAFISGTADWIDIGMYVTAALTAVGINIILKEKST